MAQLIDLTTFTDTRGNLTVIEKSIPFDIKRIFYIYGVDSSVRGGHRHHETVQAAICLQGSCRIYNNDGNKEEHFMLDQPSKCLIINPEDWHNNGSIHSRCYTYGTGFNFLSPHDYILEPYP